MLYKFQEVIIKVQERTHRGKAVHDIRKGRFQLIQYVLYTRVREMRSRLVGSYDRNKVTDFA